MQTHGYSLVQPGDRSWVLCGLIVACALWGDEAAAQFSGAPPYIAPAAAFNLKGDEGSDYFFSFDGGYLQQSGGADSCFQAPVYLPDGFSVGGVVLHGYDSSPDDDFALHLRRYALPSVSTIADTTIATANAAVSSGLMASVSTSGNSGALSPADDSIQDNSIDNWNYAYSLDLCMPGNSGDTLRLHGVEIGACADPGIEIDSAKVGEAEVFIACENIETTGTVAINVGRNVSFVAGNRVVLKDGFAVLEGAEFSAGTDAALLPPVAATTAQETGQQAAQQ